MRYRLECPANRYVFKSCLNCSESTAGSLRQSVGNVLLPGKRLYRIFSNNTWKLTFELIPSILYQRRLHGDCQCFQFSLTADILYLTKGGMVHSVSGWMRGVQIKLWDPLRTRAIPERLRGVFTTRRYTNTRLPFTLPYKLLYCCCCCCCCYSITISSPGDEYTASLHEPRLRHLTFMSSQSVKTRLRNHVPDDDVRVLQRTYEHTRLMLHILVWSQSFRKSA